MSLRHSGRAPPPRDAAIAVAAAQIQGVDGGLTKKKDYDAIAERLGPRLAARQKLTLNELRDAAWCLWETTTRLAAADETLASFLDQIRRADRKSPSRTLALSFLFSFRPDRPGLAAVARVLSALAETAGKPFDALHREFAIFDPSIGPQKVARRAHDRRIAPSALLQQAGLTASVIRAGFAEICAREALRLLAGDRRLDALDRLAFVKEIAVDEVGQLYFPAQGPDVANALLLPFEQMQPPEDICDRYLDVLIGLFGDPRTQEGRWVNMPEAAEIARRWLTRQALRQFLDVVGEVADAHMWRYRRAFWEAVYKRKLIQTAWVVFDPAGVRAAQRRFGSKVSFGRFHKGGGVQSGQSVLLLRVGRGVVAEWSHNGSCRIWNEWDRTGAPALYKQFYDAYELKDGKGYAPELTKSHNHAETYSWQGVVAEKIYRMTGARIQPPEYHLSAR
ncbi:EH signature domain-containing protein [Consotaella salsifontis]|nr:EH signature domain-containing protein [Consotaella salsifontis]